jgi:hypothetical protein
VADWGGFKMEANDSVKANLAITDALGARAMIHSDSALGAQRSIRKLPRRCTPDARRHQHHRGSGIKWLTINPAWAWLGRQDRID